MSVSKPPCRSLGTAVQRVLYRRENLIDGNLSIVVGIAFPTGRRVGVAEAECDQGEEFVDRYLPIRIAIADARRHAGARSRVRQRGAGQQAQAVVRVRLGITTAHRVEQGGAGLGTRYAHAGEVDDGACWVVQVADVPRFTRERGDTAAEGRRLG